MAKGDHCSKPISDRLIPSNGIVAFPSASKIPSHWPNGIGYKPSPQVRSVQKPAGKKDYMIWLRPVPFWNLLLSDGLSRSWKSYAAMWKPTSVRSIMFCLSTEPTLRTRGYLRVPNKTPPTERPKALEGVLSTGVAGRSERDAGAAPSVSQFPLGTRPPSGGAHGFYPKAFFRPRGITGAEL